MSDLRIDVSDMKGLAESLGSAVRHGRRDEEEPRRPRGTLLAAVRAVAIASTVAVFPFVVLIRGGIFAYREWAFGTWPALLVSVLGTACVLAAYGRVAGQRLGARENVRRLLTRAGAGLCVAYAAYALLYIAGSNVKSDEVRAEYSSVHPLLRIASSALVLVDPAAVITDAGRTREDYRRMGLPPAEASLHFEQESGFVHALDLRTSGRGELRNRAVQLAFWSLGFHTLRHVGTADHLHVSLPPPD